MQEDKKKHKNPKTGLSKEEKKRILDRNTKTFKMSSEEFNKMVNEVEDKKSHII